MKIVIKPFVHCLFILLFISHTVVSQDWIKVDIENIGELSFPEEPEIEEVNGQTMYLSENGTDFYIVTITGLGEAIPNDELMDLYEGFISGGVRASGGELISKEVLQIENRTAIDHHLKTQKNGLLPSNKYYRTFYINEKLLSLSFMSFEENGERLELKKDRFFNSINLNEKNKVSATITVDKGAIDQNFGASSTYELGYQIGRILAPLTIIIFLIGLFFLIRHLSKSNKKKKALRTSQNSNLRATTTTKNVCSKCETVNGNAARYCSKCGYEI